MACARWATLLLLLAACTSICHRAAAQTTPGTGQPVPEDNPVVTCEVYFDEVEPQLQACNTSLSAVSEDSWLKDKCPQQCRGIFKDMDPSCAPYVDQMLPGTYKGEKPSQNASHFDICDMLFCPTQECGIVLDVLRLLPLFQLPYLNLDGTQVVGATSAPSSGSSVNVGAIVAGVVLGNAVIVAVVGGFVWLRRRRHRARMVAAQHKALEMGHPHLHLHPHLPPGAALGHGGGSGTPSSGAIYAHRSGLGLDAAERGDGHPSKQALAHAWAQAAVAAGWSPPYPSPPLSSDAAAASHLQYDELEMMHLGSAATVSEREKSVQSDPLLSWVSTQLQQQAAAPPGSQTPPLAPSIGARPSDETLSPAADSGEVPPQPDAEQPEARQQGQQEGEIQDGVGELQRGHPPPVAAMSSRRRSSGWTGLDSGRSSGLVDLKPWLLEYADLKMQRPLGEGSFGKVFLATWNETLVAVKLLLSTDDAAAAAKSGSSSLAFSQPALEALQKEAGMMASLRHPNVVLFLGLCTSPPAVVTEYCSRGSLLDVLRAGHASPQAAQQLTWVRRLSMALDAAKGMLCLHARAPPIVHRDLKSPNLLVDAAWRVKVCDFNLSKILEDTARSSSAGGMLNPRWLAPEVLMGRPATAESDVFSFGTVLWELLTWRLPWEGANLYQLVFMVSRGERLPIPPPEELPGADALGPADAAAYVALIQRCWAQEPSQRPSFADIISELRSIITRVVAASPTATVAPPPAAPAPPRPVADAPAAGAAAPPAAPPQPSPVSDAPAAGAAAQQPAPPPPFLAAKS